MSGLPVSERKILTYRLNEILKTIISNIARMVTDDSFTGVK